MGGFPQIDYDSNLLNTKDLIKRSRANSADADPKDQFDQGLHCLPFCKASEI